MRGATGVDGLVSGIDTTAIVDSMIEAASGGIRIQEQKRELAQAKLDLVNQYNVKLLNAQLDLSALKRSTTYTGRSASVSNDNILSVTRSVGVEPGTYEIDVQKVARAQQLASAGFATTDTQVGTGTLDLQLGNGPVTEITLDASNGTLEGLVTAINGADAGIRAQIVNDGSDEPYRLVLTGEGTGADQTITIDASGLSGAGSELLQGAVGNDGLSGSLAGVYRGSDLPDQIDIRVKSGSDANTATYEVRVGSDGSYVDIAEADLDRSVTGEVTVDLAAVLGLDPGAGPLTATMTGSGLTAGSSSLTVRPLQELRTAQDAEVRFGSSGSSFVISRSDNRFEDLVPGLDVELGTQTGTAVVTVGQDSGSVKEAINTFVESFNDAIAFLDQHASYDSESGEAGLLLSNSGLRIGLNDLIRELTGEVDNAGDIRLLSQMGISLGDDGQLEIDNAELDAALRDQIDDVRRFFTDTGTSSNPEIEFAALGKAQVGDGTVDVTVQQAAEQAKLQGSTALTGTITVNDGSTLDLKVNGRPVSLQLVAGDYTASQLIDHLQALADAESTLAGRRPTFALNANERITITSQRHGSGQSLEVVGGGAAIGVGLPSGLTANGQDVKAVVDGRVLTGDGQVIRGQSGTAIEGLTLVSYLTQAQVDSGNDSAEVTLSQGLASRFDRAITRATDADGGLVTTIENRLAQELENLDESISRAEATLEQRRDRLFRQFINMESLLAQFQAQEQFLSGQLEAFANMASSSSRRR